MATADPSSRPPRHPGSNRGIWTIVAIFALGFAVLGGLFLAPRGRAPALPAGTPRGLPERPFVGVLLDCRPLGVSPDAIVAAVRALEPAPDLILLVDVEASLVPSVIQSLGLQASYHPQLYQRVRPSADADGKVGLCVLSKHPLYGGRPIRLGPDRPVGVAVDVVAGGRAFTAACVDVREPLFAGSRPAPAGDAAEAFGGVDVVAGRSAGALFVEAGGIGSTAPSAGGGTIEVLRRMDAPAALTFRLGGAADPATRLN